MYHLIRGLAQLYYNECERRLLRKLMVPRTRKQVRVRAPFSIVHPELINIGLNTEFNKNTRIGIYPDLVDEASPYSKQLIIGEHCYFGNRITFLVGADITLGDYVLVADDVSFVSENHGMNPESDIPYMDQKLSAAPITVGDNCWIGEKAVITPGVTIGKGCIIGAMSIVTKDIPDYSVAVGIPAKVIKKYDFEKHCWVRT